MTNDSDRLFSVIQWSGLTTNSFAREIGLHRAESLYQIKKGKHRISKDLAEIIVSRYENINKEWLTTGCGEMLFDSSKPSPSVFPFFAHDINLCTPWIKGDMPDSYITLPVYKGCDFACYNMSDSMEPELPKGSIVFFKEVKVREIVLGKSYYIISDNFKGIRTLRQGDSSSQFKMTPINTEKYDTMAVTTSEIKRIFMVRGIIIDKTL